MKIKPINIYRTIRRYYRDYNASKHYQIKLFNCQWKSNYIPDHWLYQFIVKRGLLNNHSKKTISIFSVNGNKFAIHLNRSDYKIFYTIENVHVPYSHWQNYEDLLLTNNSINLSIGFDYLDNDKYIRFPYWLMTTFKPDSDYKSILQICNQINRHKIDLKTRNRFCSLVCRYDYFGNRRIMLNNISTVDHIDSDGQFMKNNNDLKNKFNDDKLEYLKMYKFNLCPENSDNKGYVTEKIFDAIQSGCIPIYWGSENNPEPEILKDRKSVV